MRTNKIVTTYGPGRVAPYPTSQTSASKLSSYPASKPVSQPGGQTSLIRASSEGKVDAVTLLIEKRADVNTKDRC